MQLGKVLGSMYDDDGFLCIQIETFGGGAKWCELSNTDGFQSRPVDPDANGGGAWRLVAAGSDKNK